MSSIKERLRRHSEAFEQLLSLIPAKHYFSASDSNTQWNKRKQTKQESQRAKKAKLDPDTVMSAADFGRRRQEKERFCGREDEGQEMKEGQGVERGNSEELVVKNQEKQKRIEGFAKESKTGLEGGKDIEGNYKLISEIEELRNDGEAETIQLSGFNISSQHSYSPSSPTLLSTSLKRLGPPFEVPPGHRLEQKARLEARIQQLRAKRNADLPDGTPVRNRNELMAVRRREEAQARKGRKKEIRLKQKNIVEKTKSVVLSPKKNSPNKDGKLGEGKGQANVQRNTSIKPPIDNKDKDKGNMPKKTNSKKNRPGFEGSLKASKKGKK